MVTSPKRIRVSPGSELARMLDEAAVAPVLLERDGVLYRLEREPDDLWAGYDPDQVRKAVRETAGSWAALDADALIARIHRAREEGSRPADRP